MLHSEPRKRSPAWRNSGEDEDPLATSTICRSGPPVVQLDEIWVSQVLHGCRCHRNKEADLLQQQLSGAATESLIGAHFPNPAEMATAAMAAHRASFPLRLQHILSGSRAIAPAIKVDSEPLELGIRMSSTVSAMPHG